MFREENMADTPNGQQSGKQQANIAYIVLGFGAGCVLLLSVIGIIVDRANTMTIFNIVLPVIATWVGTVLAFYFGRENYVSASEQTRALLKQTSPAEVANEAAELLMRPIKEMVCITIQQAKDDKSILLKEITPLFTVNVTRLPILDYQKVPKYMIHQGRIDNFNAAPDKPVDTDTLDDFITSEKGKDREYGKNTGFILVSRQTLVADAKKQMEMSENCQDIFVTENGKDNEPLLGWISDGKLSQYLES
jgi:hypothetical protein